MRDETKAAVTYRPWERLGLWAVAVVGLVGINGAFLYGAFLRPELLRAAMTNPVSVAFMGEAWVLMGVLAYLFGRWGVSRLRWPWFVILSLLGGLAFAVPVVLLAPVRERAARRPPEA